MPYTPDERIAAAKKSIADLRSTCQRWRDGKDARDMREIISDMDGLADCADSYLDGEPGPYLDGTADGPPCPSSPPAHRMQG